MNEPVGVLRVVDPFRAGDPSLCVEPAGYRVAVERMSWPPRAAEVFRIAASAAREGARIVHARGHAANVFAVAAARLVRARSICTGSPLGLTERLAVRSAAAVLCATAAEREGCVRRGWVPPARVFVVHPGVDLARFSARMPDERPLIAAVGSLYARNGHVGFLEALARVRRSVPEVQAVCAGEGPMRPVLEQRIAHLGLKDVVQLAGHVEDVAALLARAHAAWTPGPRATIEAMAAGVPVASPWSELVGADLAVRPHDEAALGERLIACLREGARKSAPALRQKAEKHFSLDALRARLRAVYDELLAPNRAAA